MVRNTKSVCPKCGSDKVLRILYGLLREPEKIDETKYYVAGCVVEDFDWHCTNCRYEWEKGGKGRYAEDDEVTNEKIGLISG